MDESELKNLQCPQNWGYDKYRDSEKRLEILWLNDEDNNENNTKYGAQVDKFKMNCLKSFEAYRKGKYHEALVFLDSADISDGFIVKYERVFKHVIRASRAFVLFAMKSFNEAKKICDELNNEGTFSCAEEAVIKYLKCKFQLFYGEPNEDGCIELIQDAVNTVPGEAEFHYVLGLTMSRIRHFEHPPKPPSEKEIDSLKTALSLRQDSLEYSVSLARLYLDLSHNCKGDKKHFRMKAANIYRNLLRFHESLSGNDISRCVYGLTRIQFDPDLEEYVEIAKKKSDSTLTNHYCGIFYLNSKQYVKALECLKKTISELPYIASQLLLLLYRVNGNHLDESEIISHVEDWTKYYDSPEVLTKKKIEFHLVVSQFYLIVMDNLKSASCQFLKSAEYGITKPNYINLSQRHGNINYLILLKGQLSAYNGNDVTILNANKTIKNLPTEIVTVRNPRYSIPELSKIKQYLYLTTDVNIL